MATSKSNKTAGPADKGLRVVSRSASFRRAGYQFGPEPREIAFSDMTSEQADLIREEGRPGGMLVVTEIDIKPAEEAKA